MEIEVGSGKARVGVCINASDGSGFVKTDGLKKVGDDYINDAYDSGKVTLELKVVAGSGVVDLKVVS